MKYPLETSDCIKANFSDKSITGDLFESFLVIIQTRAPRSHAYHGKTIELKTWKIASSKA